MAIGKQIRDLRKSSEFEFTQADIEEKTGVGQNVQSDIENGKVVPFATTLQRLMEPYKSAGYELRYIHGEFCIVKVGEEEI